MLQKLRDYSSNYRARALLPRVYLLFLTFINKRKLYFFFHSVLFKPVRNFHSTSKLPWEMRLIYKFCETRPTSLGFFFFDSYLPFLVLHKAIINLPRVAMHFVCLLQLSSSLILSFSFSHTSLSLSESHTFSHFF